MPVTTASALGVERTGGGANSLTGSPVKSVPRVMTRGSRRISSATASSSAFWKLISRMVPSPSLREHVDQEILRIGERARLGEGHGEGEGGGDAFAHRADLPGRQQALA